MVLEREVDTRECDALGSRPLRVPPCQRTSGAESSTRSKSGGLAKRFKARAKRVRQSVATILQSATVCDLKRMRERVCDYLATLFRMRLKAIFWAFFGSRSNSAQSVRTG